jgi:hypothetical protein
MLRIVEVKASDAMFGPGCGDHACGIAVSKAFGSTSY